MVRVFANGPGVQYQVESYHSKIALDTAFNTQHYKVGINGRVERPRDWSSALPYTSV